MHTDYPRQFPRAQWSILFQIAAESDLVQEMVNIYDRIAKIGSILGKVNFIVLYDGLHIEGMEGLAKPSIYYVRQSVFFAEEACTPVMQLQSDNLMKNGVFKEGIAAIVAQFPADNWAYIYCGHGAPGGTDISNGRYLTKLNFRLRFGNKLETDEQLAERLSRLYEKDGWTIEHRLQLQGTESDRNILVILSKARGDLENLSYFQLGQMLQGSFAGQLKFICLDTCWGQLAENALAFMDVTDFLVGSVDEMPVMGIGYESFCRLLTENSSIKPFELASLITATFYQSNYNDYMSSPEFSKMGVSLSCVSLVNSRKLFNGSFNRLLTYMINHIGKLRGLICRCRKLCKDHTYSPSDVFKAYNIDLVRFLENVIFFIGNKDTMLVTLCLQVIAEIKMYSLKSFIANNYGEVEPGKEALGGYGFTICFPPNLADYNSSIYGESAAAGNAHLHRDWPWKIFLQKYLADLDGMSNGYSEKFSSNGPFREYAEYITSEKEDEKIVKDVKGFVASLTTKPNLYTSSTNKWEEF